MAATVQIHSWHGAGAGSGTNINNGEVRFKLADNDTVDLNAPLRVPTQEQVDALIAYTYSFRKYFKVNFTTTPSSSISNLRFFTDGNNLDAQVVLLADQTDTYQENVSADSTGDTTAHWLAVSYTKASPLVVNSGTVLSNPSTGYGTQDFVMVQAMVSASATAGVVGPQVWSYRYDEQ